jgi:hypothetical protein
MSLLFGARAHANSNLIKYSLVVDLNFAYEHRELISDSMSCFLINFRAVLFSSWISYKARLTRLLNVFIRNLLVNLDQSWLLGAEERVINF